MDTLLVPRFNILNGMQQIFIVDGIFHAGKNFRDVWGHLGGFNDSLFAIIVNYMVIN